MGKNSGELKKTWVQVGKDEKKMGKRPLTRKNDENAQKKEKVDAS